MGKKNFFKAIKQTGQTLLELVIALSLLIVIVSVVAIATANGLRASQNSKNQIQATKLAQDGIEKVRAMRDRGYRFCGYPGYLPGSANDEQVFSYFWTAPPSGITCGANGCSYLIKTAATAQCAISDPFWLEYQTTTTAEEQITSDNSTFGRRVIVVDDGSNSKQIRVIVTWKDSLGTHQSFLNTILTNY